MDSYLPYHGVIYETILAKRPLLFGKYQICCLTSSILQIQRNLQLRIEEQGRYLQMMFEKQCKSGSDSLKGTSSTMENNIKESSGAAQSSPANDDSGLQAPISKTGVNQSNASTASGENSQDRGEKYKSQETQVLENSDANVDGTSPSTKRAKVHE